MSRKLLINVFPTLHFLQPIVRIGVLLLPQILILYDEISDFVIRCSPVGNTQVFSGELVLRG